MNQALHLANHTNVEHRFLSSYRKIKLGHRNG